MRKLNISRLVVLSALRRQELACSLDNTYMTKERKCAPSMHNVLNQSMLSCSSRAIISTDFYNEVTCNAMLLKAVISMPCATVSAVHCNFICPVLSNI